MKFDIGDNVKVNIKDVRPLIKAAIKQGEIGSVVDYYIGRFSKPEVEVLFIDGISFFFFEDELELVEWN